MDTLYRSDTNECLLNKGFTVINFFTHNTPPPTPHEFLVPALFRELMHLTVFVVVVVVVVVVAFLPYCNYYLSN